ncbi:hypothetical protein P8452_66767 [Trifolium repens]|nr:hypothetical protein P8452_66767 [Trifolium repens]
MVCDKVTARQRLDLNLERGRTREELSNQSAETKNLTDKLDRVSALNKHGWRPITTRVKVLDPIGLKMSALNQIKMQNLGLQPSSHTADGII